MTFEKTTIIGTSTESFTAAADDAIDRAEQRYEQVKWAETNLRGVEVANADGREYQVEAVIAYEVA
jgi:flavin-binding protein dodecin